jgi:hypothetical protein
MINTMINKKGFFFTSLHNIEEPHVLICIKVHFSKIWLQVHENRTLTRIIVFSS